MAKKVTQKEQERMWKLYQEYGCFKTVAKKMRRSPDTVSKYVHMYEAAVAVAGIMKNSNNY